MDLLRVSASWVTPLLTSRCFPCKRNGKKINSIDKNALIYGEKGFNNAGRFHVDVKTGIPYIISFFNISFGHLTIKLRRVTRSCVASLFV